MLGRMYKATVDQRVKLEIATSNMVQLVYGDIERDMCCKINGEPVAATDILATGTGWK